MFTCPKHAIKSFLECYKTVWSPHCGPNDRFMLAGRPLVFDPRLQKLETHTFAQKRRKLNK